MRSAINTCEERASGGFCLLLNKLSLGWNCAARSWILRFLAEYSLQTMRTVRSCSISMFNLARHRLLLIGLGCAILVGAGGASLIVAPAVKATLASSAGSEEFKVKHDQVQCLNERRGRGKVMDELNEPYDPHRVTYKPHSVGCHGPLTTISLADIIQILSQEPPPRRRDAFLRSLHLRIAEAIRWIVGAHLGSIGQRKVPE